MADMLMKEGRTSVPKSASTADTVSMVYIIFNFSHLLPLSFLRNLIVSASGHIFKEVLHKVVSLSSACLIDCVVVVDVAHVYMWFLHLDERRGLRPRR